MRAKRIAYLCVGILCVALGAGAAHSEPKATVRSADSDSGAARPSAAAVQPMELLDRIDSFYNRAWDKLVIYGSVTALIAGILVPLLVRAEQKRALKQDEAKLKEEINERVRAASDELRKEILAEVDSTRDRLLRAAENAVAGVLLVQGRAAIDRGDFMVAIQSHARSILRALLSGDASLVDVCVGNLIDTVSSPVAEKAMSHLDARRAVAEAIAALRTANIDAQHTAAIEMLEARMQAFSPPPRPTPPARA